LAVLYADASPWLFYMLMHPARQRCEPSGYPDIPAFSRLASRAPQRLKFGLFWGYILTTAWLKNEAVINFK
jgi:hypothetical protein